MVALAVAAGLVVSVQSVHSQRTQAPGVAAVHRGTRPAGRHHRLLPGPARPRHLPSGDQPLPVQDGDLPTGDRTPVHRLGRLQKASRAGNPTPFTATLAVDAGSTHRIWLVWEGGYQTFGVKCEELTDTLGALPGVTRRNWVTDNMTKILRAHEPDRVLAQGRRRSVSRLWVRLRQPVSEAILPFLLARVVVLGVLGLAHFVVDRTHPSTPGVAARVHDGLLGWDAGWYESIARVGYGPLGHQSLRFFPLVPLMTHAVAWLPGVGDGTALIVVANVAAFVATVLLFVLVRRETGDIEVARRSIWFLSLAPAAFVLVMGYAESVFLCLAVGCFLALRRGENRPNFALAALLGFAAALTRPIGVLLALGHRRRVGALVGPPADVDPGGWA